MPLRATRGGLRGLRLLRRGRPGHGQPLLDRQPPRDGLERGPRHPRLPAHGVARPPPPRPGAPPRSGQVARGPRLREHRPRGQPGRRPRPQQGDALPARPSPAGGAGPRPPGGPGLRHLDGDGGRLSASAHDAARGHDLGPRTGGGGRARGAGGAGAGGLLLPGGSGPAAGGAPGRRGQSRSSSATCSGCSATAGPRPPSGRDPTSRWPWPFSPWPTWPPPRSWACCSCSCPDSMRRARSRWPTAPSPWWASWPRWWWRSSKGCCRWRRGCGATRDGDYTRMPPSLHAAPGRFLPGAHLRRLGARRPPAGRGPRPGPIPWSFGGGPAAARGYAGPRPWARAHAAAPARLPYDGSHRPEWPGALGYTAVISFRPARHPRPPEARPLLQGPPSRRLLLHRRRWRPEDPAHAGRPGQRPRADPARRPLDQRAGHRALRRAVPLHPATARAAATSCSATGETVAPVELSPRPPGTNGPPPPASP